MTERVGVIGLGVMGSGMARNLISASFEVLGFDVDPARAEELEALGGRTARTAGEAVADCAVVIFSLPSEAALEAVSAEVAASASPGLICLETGTFTLEAKEAARTQLADSGVELLDTPLSGTGLQAADGSLVVFASGSQEGCRNASTVIAAISRSSHYLGDFGNGSKMKYVANLLVGIHNLATAEAHALAAAAGLDPARVQEVMADGVGSSKIFEIRGPKIVAGNYDPSARLDLMVKDSAIIKDFAVEVGARTPLLDAAIPVYQEASQAGLGDLDPAALFLHLGDRPVPGDE